MSIHIPVGKRTAIVGASGSGKSTLASLLTRTWDPASGAVTIGGTNVAEVSCATCARRSPPRPSAPTCSTTLCAPTCCSPRPMRARPTDARAGGSGPHRLAGHGKGRPGHGGWRHGQRLSGGQRQRLALARALLRDAPIYVFDEATSQVDPATEARVREGIARVTGEGRTIVEIAHRISAVRDADQIIVMDAGRVVETGTYGELHARGGALAALGRRETTDQPSA